MAGGKLAKISVSAIQLSALKITIKRNASVKCLQIINSEMNKVPSAWNCPTGNSFMYKVRQMHTKDWQIPIHALNLYLTVLHTAASNYSFAETENTSNQRSDRDRYRKSGGR